MPRMPAKNPRFAERNPIDSILLCSSSTKETMTMTPAENPNVALIKRGPGFLTNSPKKLPIVVESPARLVSSKAIATLFSIYYRGRSGSLRVPDKRNVGYPLTGETRPTKLFFKFIL